MISFLLSACEGKSSRFIENQKYVDEIKNNTPPPIESIPAIHKFEKFSYVVNGRRDPFEPSLSKSRENIPDMNRPKEELEAFPLDSLKMVGVLRKSSKVWALILAGNGMVYQLGVGSHLGKNFGEVKKITNDEVILIETVPNGFDGWTKRETTISLQK